MKILTDEQATILSAFFDAFDTRTTGVWAVIAEELQEMGFDDPEGDLEAARAALQG